VGPAHGLASTPAHPQGELPVRRFNGPHAYLSCTQRQYRLTPPPWQGDFIWNASPLGLILENAMPRGDKSSYTDKQKRQAEHIEEGYEKKASAKQLLKNAPGPREQNHRRREKIRLGPQVLDCNRLFAFRFSLQLMLHCVPRAKGVGTRYCSVAALPASGSTLRGNTQARDEDWC